MKFGYQGGYLMDNRKPLLEQPVPDVPDQQRQCRIRSPKRSIDSPIRSASATTRSTRRRQWTMGRITLQGALRLDSATSIFPEAQIGGVRFLPTVTTFPETKGVDAYKDLTPRGGVAYDVFGNGKTAVKFSVGRYLEAAQNGGLFIASRPTSRVSTTATRTWTDANGNFMPGLRSVEQRPAGPAGDRRRFLRRGREHELRQVGLRHDAGSGAVLRLGRAVRRLAVGRLGSAAGGAASVGRGRLPPALAAEFRRHRQPARSRGQLRPVHRSQPRSTRGCPNGGGYADSRPAVQREPVQGVRGGQQLRDARHQLRRTEPDVELRSRSTSARGPETAW